MRIIKKGQIIAFTEGEYSDYTLVDHLRAQQDFHPAREMDRFKLHGDYLAAPDYAPQAQPDTAGCHTRFLAWLIREGLCSPVKNVVELHIGDWGDELEAWMRPEKSA